MGKKQDSISLAGDAAFKKALDLFLQYGFNVTCQSPYTKWEGGTGRRDLLITLPNGFKVSVEVKSVGPRSGTAFDKIKSFAHDIMEQEIIDAKPEYKHQSVNVALCVCVPSGPKVSPYAIKSINASRAVIKRRNLRARVLMYEELASHLVNDTLENILNLQ